MLKAAAVVTVAAKCDVGSHIKSVFIRVLKILYNRFIFSVGNSTSQGLYKWYQLAMDLSFYEALWFIFSCSIFPLQNLINSPHLINLANPIQCIITVPVHYTCTRHWLSRAEPGGSCHLQSVTAFSFWYIVQRLSLHSSKYINFISLDAIIISPTNLQIAASITTDNNNNTNTIWNNKINAADIFLQYYQHEATDSCDGFATILAYIKFAYPLHVWLAVGVLFFFCKLHTRAPKQRKNLLNKSINSNLQLSPITKYLQITLPKRYEKVSNFDQI